MDMTLRFKSRKIEKYENESEALESVARVTLTTPKKNQANRGTCAQMRTVTRGTNTRVDNF